MKMDINELVLQMTYAAAQMAQNTIPQTQEPTRTEDGKSFQNLMDEKRTERTERESKAPETTTAATQTAQQGQTAASGAPVMQQLAAMVTDTAVIPAVVNTAVTVPGAVFDNAVSSCRASDCATSASQIFNVLPCRYV